MRIMRADWQLQTNIQTMKKDWQTNIQTLRTDWKTSIQTISKDQQTNIQTTDWKLTIRKWVRLVDQHSDNENRLED